MELDKALLVGVNVNQKDFDHSMIELASLVEACEMEVVGSVVQNLPHVNIATYMGTGKVEEVRIYLEHTEADVIVFNNELSPSQLRNLGTVFDCKIFDRTALILEIFAQRARTSEARLQVEMAALQYQLPRIRGAGDALSRQGGSTGGAGNRSRGAGEQKLELDRRRIEDRIAKIAKQLQSIAKKRETRRKKRTQAAIPVVALVGYTNAGKSSLMNAMINHYEESHGKLVMAKDMLFATLDTTVRKITTDHDQTFLLADTVGFVSNLPHNLVQAFHSTLEEVREADLLLHVVDCSDPNFAHQRRVTEDTLKQIEADHVPVIYVFNKADLINDSLPGVEIANEIYISALNGDGISELVEMVANEIFSDYIDCCMLIPYREGRLLDYFKSNAHIQEIKYHGDGIAIHMICRPSDYNRYQEYVITESDDD